ncbi:hypothetical protein [Natronorubrum sulfidifaciens]|uniref:hypothetical protein n=1 Tax=Natronorubrum sulfidifaciens TaxID=388259 RepID=UPI001266EF58|nr:hypothetical protein [Natronorubrum sulfidifaciens]
MAENDDNSELLNRRNVITHIGAVIFGWALGAFLDPFRRFVNKLIAGTPLGRKPQIAFGYAKSQKVYENGYMLRIANSGEETAENLSLHVGFEEKITDVKAEDWVNTPPSPEVNTEIIDGGIARVDVDVVRREFREHFNPLEIHFAVEEGSQSNFAYRIDDDETIYTTYRYSWMFLGERYYESTEYHLAGEN